MMNKDEFYGVLMSSKPIEKGEVFLNEYYSAFNHVWNVLALAVDVAQTEDEALEAIEAGKDYATSHMCFSGSVCHLVNDLFDAITAEAIREHDYRRNEAPFGRTL